MSSEYQGFQLPPFSLTVRSGANLSRTAVAQVFRLETSSSRLLMEVSGLSFMAPWSSSARVVGCRFFMGLAVMVRVAALAGCMKKEHVISEWSEMIGFFYNNRAHKRVRFIFPRDDKI